MKKSELGSLLFIIVVSIMFIVVGVIIDVDYKREIAKKSTEYSALNDAFQSEMDRSHELEDVVIQKDAEIARLEDNMDKLAAMQPILSFITPIEAFKLLDNLPQSSPFDSSFKVTARFGEGPGYNGGYRTSHQGTDIVPTGSWRVHPMWPGVVEDIGIHQFYGKYVIVDHGNGVRTRYCHLEKIFNTALPESVVTPDTIIGIMGSTGYSDAAHLHLELSMFTDDNWQNIDIYPFLRR